jgi:hypothetical protein
MSATRRRTYWPLAWFWRAFGKRFIFDHHDLSPEMFAVKFERPATLEAAERCSRRCCSSSA